MFDGYNIDEESKLIKRIENDLKLQFEESQKTDVPGELEGKWSSLTSSEPKRFINPDMTLKVDVLRNFRKLDIFIKDAPGHSRCHGLFNNDLFYYIKQISGGERGISKSMKEIYTFMKENNCLDLLKKYPVSPVGNPNIFKYKGYTYTLRWIKHIYFLSVFKEILQDKLISNYTALDIGCSYGIFSSLLKKECNTSHHILLDFPEQLVLAHYFLGCTFPQAKIATYKEVSEVESIDREFIEKYDFILLPWFLYKKLKSNSIDIITNFTSFAEMSRKWFDYYIKSEPFLSTKYFYTNNHIQSYPTYDTDLTILDYPLHDFKKLHFRISPFFSHTYIRKYWFFYEKLFFSKSFEFIGERKS